MTSTSATPVAVTFAVTFDYQRYYSEAELGTADIESRLRSARTLEGAIQIRAGSAAGIEIVDELAPQIQNLCLGAVPALVDGRPLHVLYYSREGHLDLMPQGDVAILSGDLIATLTLPRLALARALFACAERFFAFASQIRAADPAYMANLAYMRQHEERAVAALERTGPA